MQCITKGPVPAIEWPPPGLDLSPLAARMCGKLGLTPLEVLIAVNGPALARWAVWAGRGWVRHRLARPPRGRRPTYEDATIVLLALVQTAWQMPYAVVLDYVREHPELAVALGLPQDHEGRVRVISQGQYWERRQALGLLPLLLFVLGLVAQLVRLGVITGHKVILDATRLKAWHHHDPGATWVRYRGQEGLFGYKVHTLLCHDSVLPILCVVTPAHVHDAVLAIPMLLAAVLLFQFRIWIVYADAAYFEYRILGFVVQVLGASAAINFNSRRRGKRSLATLFFIRQWRRYVLRPRTDIERHFAWAKRYFGLKCFQCWTYLRVSQYCLLTYAVVLAVALAAERYGRPDLRLRRAQVLARALPS